MMTLNEAQACVNRYCCLQINIVSCQRDDRYSKIHAERSPVSTAKNQWGAICIQLDSLSGRRCGYFRCCDNKFSVLHFQLRACIFFIFACVDSTAELLSNEKLKGMDPKLVGMIESEIMYQGARITWDDIGRYRLPDKHAHHDSAV